MLTVPTSFLWRHPALTVMSGARHSAQGRGRGLLCQNIWGHELHELWRIYASHRVQTYYWNLERLTEEDLPKFNEIAKRDFNREIILTGLLPEDVKEWYEGLR